MKEVVLNIAELVSGPPLACRPDVDIAEAASVMTAQGVGSLAVIDGERLVGILTDRDVVAAVARGGLDGRRVSDIMTPDPDTIDVSLGVDDALDWLNATGYRHLPVMDSGRLVGIVSMKDLLWALGERLRNNKRGISYAG